MDVDVGDSAVSVIHGHEGQTRVGLAGRKDQCLPGVICVSASASTEGSP